MSLFDFGLSMQEPDLLYLGDIELVDGHDNECGRWTYWIIDNCFTDYCEDYETLDVDYIHDCNGYHPNSDYHEGCVLDE